ncbi:flavin-containing monooxygenase 5-like [Mya arenaria]|uniref:flavin-containing monooxygenase 5-like n=1 Tax=Mya arenaria TaxID=6604 RepID=UPI0022E4177A|nr:flavin-containing monooxygenase 5-like [Mya arenaria]
MSVAVIGAGASGLTAIKCCLDEGLEPVCFERSPYIGGLWHYTTDAEEGQACVMKSTVINTSKEMMCYSDFPIPAEYAFYMHNTKVDSYLNMYADKFNLKKYIQLNTDVLSVKPSESVDGKWDIVTKVKGSSDTNAQTFDTVLVCTGHHADKNIPDFPDLDKFKGKVVHTHDYRDYHGYEDKRVLIIGIGNSGGDVATELSRISSQIYLSTRSGSWFYHRVADNGDPIDMLLFTRFLTWLRTLFPYFAGLFVKYKLNSRFDHAKYSIQPNYLPLNAHPTVNDELPNRIASGGVIVKANVSHFTETGAVFDDGTTEENIDCVVLATGYIFGFPFLNKSVIDVKNNKVELFKYMFPPDLKKPTLAVIGCIQPLGSIMPISEMQCRLAARVFNGKSQLPDRSSMWEDIRGKQEAMARRYKASPRHTIQVEYITFMDELAELIGCKPDIAKLLLSDPLLGWNVLFGPGTPYQYRIQGPGTWKDSRKCILTQWERTYAPLKTRPLPVPDAGTADSPNISALQLLINIPVFIYRYLFTTNKK